MVQAAPSSLGTALRNLRLDRGIGLNEAARRCGASPAALSAWENGNRRPRGPALARLLDALGADGRTKARLLQLAEPQQAHLALAGSPLGAPVEVGTVLRTMRERKGVAQAELARWVGTTQATISRWEGGEAAPSVEAVHAVGFALGATVEETLALASAIGQGEGGLSDDPVVAYGQVWSLIVPGVLNEITLVGWEAELRRRSGRDSGWDACLITLLAAKANLFVYEERYREIAPIALRAVELAETRGERIAAVPAIAALADADRALGRGHARAAELAETWAAALPASGFKAWMIQQSGLCLIRMGRTVQGLDRVARASEMDLDTRDGHPEPWSHRTATLCPAYLEAGDPRRAAALLDGRRERHIAPSIFISVDHANGRAATETEMAYLRVWTEHWSPTPLARTRLTQVERRQVRLTGGRSTAPSADDWTEDGLWDAVVRENRG